MESIVDKMSIRNENPLLSETSKSISGGGIFGRMIMKMVSGIPECEEKISTENKDIVKYNKGPDD